MGKHSLFWLLLAPVAFAQTDVNSITYTSSRTVSLPSDQIDFSIIVITPRDATLDQVLQAMQPSGLTAANLYRVDPAFSNPPALQWNFDLAIPLAKVQTAVAALTKAQASQAGFTVSFNGQGTRSTTSTQDFLACPTADLLADATAQAQTLALLAGGTLGQILALSDGGGEATQAFAAYFAVPTPTSITGTLTSTFSLNSLFFYAPPVTTCTLTVKFALLRYS